MGEGQEPTPQEMKEDEGPNVQSTKHFSGVSCRCHGPLMMVHRLYTACAGGRLVRVRRPTHWLVGCRYTPRRRVGVVAFASINLIDFLPGGNLDLAELAVPILVFGVVA